jgi:hypothetical protein
MKNPCPYQSLPSGAPLAGAVLLPSITTTATATVIIDRRQQVLGRTLAASRNTLIKILIVIEDVLVEDHLRTEGRVLALVATALEDARHRAITERIAATAITISPHLTMSSLAVALVVSIKLHQSPVRDANAVNVTNLNKHRSSESTVPDTHTRQGNVKTVRAKIATENVAPSKTSGQTLKEIDQRAECRARRKASARNTLINDTNSVVEGNRLTHF